MATSFYPLVTRIEEILSAGAGTDRVISAGTFDTKNFFLDKDEESLSRDALQKTQVSARVETIRNENRVSENANFALYDIIVRIDVAYKAPTSLDASQRRIFESLISSDVHTIRKALSNPNNLNQTEGGADTGLASGMLLFDSAGAPTFDYPNAIARNTLRFAAIVQLTY